MSRGKMAAWGIGLFTILAVFIPGGAFLPYHGFPISVWELWWLAIWIVAVMVFPWEKRKKTGVAVAATLALFVILEIAAYLLYPTGWSVCVRRVYEPQTLTTLCEPSAADREGVKGFTYQEIDFTGKNLPLYFMNERAFHYHAEGAPDRHDMPYEFLAEAYFNPVEDTALVAEVNMEDVLLRVGEEERVISSDSGADITLAGGRITKVGLYYQGHRDSSDLIKMETDARPFRSRGGALGWQGGILVIKWLVYGCLLVLSLVGSWSLMEFIQGLDRGGRRAVLFGAAAVAAYYFGDESSPAIIAGIILLIGFLTAYAGKDRKRVALVMVLLMLILSIRQVSLVMNFDELILLTGGDDLLTHEGLARSVMKSTSWSEFFRGDSNAVFYFQPLHRYILGLEHRLLGEGLAGPIVIQVWLMGLAMMMAVVVIAMVGGTLAAAIGGLLLFAGMATGDNNWLALSLMPHQEAVALPFFVMGVSGAILLIFGKLKHPGAVLGVGLLWGIAIGTRTNLAPAALGLGIIAGTWMVRRELKQAAALSLGFLTPLGAIILRNWLVAGEAKLFTSSIIPNVIPDLRGYIPGPEGPSDFGLGQVISILGHEFEGRRGELSGILWRNALTHYVGEETVWQVIWLAFIVLTVVMIGLARGKSRALMMVLFFAVTMPMLFGSLFLHRAVAVRTHNNVMIALAFALAVGIAGPYILRMFQIAKYKMQIKQKSIK